MILGKKFSNAAKKGHGAHQSLESAAGEGARPTEGGSEPAAVGLKALFA
jgi:hypothetical protein